MTNQNKKIKKGKKQLSFDQDFSMFCRNEIGLYGWEYKAAKNWIQSALKSAREEGYTRGYSKGHSIGYLEGLKQLKVGGDILQKRAKQKERNRILGIVEGMKKRKRSEVSRFYEKRDFGKSAVEEIDGLEDGYNQALIDIKEKLAKE